MKYILSCIILFFCSFSIFGQYEKRIATHQQPLNQADISVSNVKFENYLHSNSPAIPQVPGTYQIDRPTPVDSPNVKCSITVHNANDIDASETILVAVLPVEVFVLSLPSNATQHKSVTAPFYPGYITFNLGHMTPGQNITVSFAFMRSKYGNKVGAYVYSVIPDPNPGNNYKEAGF